MKITDHHLSGQVGFDWLDYLWDNLNLLLLSQRFVDSNLFAEFSLSLSKLVYKFEIVNFNIVFVLISLLVHTY